MRQIVDGLPYPILVSDDAAQTVAKLAARASLRAVIVHDRNVLDRARLVTEAMRCVGCDVLAHVSVVAGERCKRWQTVSDLHARFIEAAGDRTSVIVAIGGGTLTDVAGFAAATFLRGVPWLAVSTTVLGMVDAAIGGKTGIDRPEGKNLVGVLWQPLAAVADVAALATLPARERLTGMAEIVKAAVIGDPGLLDDVVSFDVAAPPHAWMPLLARASRVKAMIVARDLADRGDRAVLNLGHTFGHAIEHASRYRISHGAAVALGLRGAGILARDHTGWSHADHQRVLQALRKAGLSSHAARLPLDETLAAMRVDKKRADGSVRFVLPRKLGDVRQGFHVEESAVHEALASLRSPPVADGW